MSIAHLDPSPQDLADRGVDRTPPHDLLAEQSTIGGMLLSKDAVADVIETARGVDFYIPKHEVIFDAILSLYSHGEPTDVIAVTDELTKTGLLSRAGGAEYLHSVTSMVPTAANAGYYAAIVAEKAVLRRLVDAGTRIVQMGYASEGEVTDLVNSAQAEVYNVAGGVQTEDYVPLTDAIGAAIDEIEAAKGRDGQMTGVPTGFSGLDAPDERLPPRAAHHRRRTTRTRQVDARARPVPRRRAQARPDRRVLLARDGARRDRHAPAVRRVERAAAEHAQGHRRLP